MTAFTRQKLARILLLHHRTRSAPTNDLSWCPFLPNSVFFFDYSLLQIVSGRLGILILFTGINRLSLLVSRNSVAMADSKDSKPNVPVQRSTKPVSEALLNEKVRHQRWTSGVFPHKIRHVDTPHHTVGSIEPYLPLPHKHTCSLLPPPDIRTTRLIDLLTPSFFLFAVGSRYLVDAHSFLARSVVRCCLLGPPVQAQGVARVAWSWFRRWTRLGRSRQYVMNSPPPGSQPAVRLEDVTDLSFPGSFRWGDSPVRDALRR